MRFSGVVAVGARLVCSVFCILLAAAVIFTNVYTLDYQGHAKAYIVAAPGIVANDERGTLEWWQSRVRLVRGALVLVGSPHDHCDRQRWLVTRRPPSQSPPTQGGLSNSIRLPVDADDGEGFGDRRFDDPTSAHCWTWWVRYDTARATHTWTFWFPLWMPLAACSVPTLWPWAIQLRALLRTRRGLCGGCGYDRRGLASDAVCYECGKSSA